MKVENNQQNHCDRTNGNAVPMNCQPDQFVWQKPDFVAGDQSDFHFVGHLLLTLRLGIYSSRGHPPGSYSTTVIQINRLVLSRKVNAAHGVIRNAIFRRFISVSSRSKK